MEQKQKSFNSFPKTSHIYIIFLNLQSATIFPKAL